MNYLTALAVFLIVGYALGRGAGKIHLPEVVGLILCGVLVGPSALGLFSKSFLENFKVIEIVALSFIAYQIGGELDLRQVHREGKALGFVVFFQAFAAYACVAGLVWLWSKDIVFSTLLAATAVATAPASVKAVLDESRAQGPFTKFLYHVVAIDDFFAVLFFALTLSILGLEGHIVLHSVYEIVGALCIGTVLGFGIYLLQRHHAQVETLLIYEVGGLLLGVGVSLTYGFSYLIAGMMFGFTLVNLSRQGRNLFALSRSLERVIYVIFFVLIGTQFELNAILKMGWIGFLYVIGRAVGKFVGVKIGGTIGRAPGVIRSYLGAGLLPQEGVTIGLVYVIGGRYPQLSQAVTAVVLSAIIINEIIGPLGVRWAVTKAGEARFQEDEKE